MKSFNGYMHGINLGGWFSQCDYSKERYDYFIKEEDLAQIKRCGLDHVRLPVDYNLVEEKDGAYIEEGFARIEQVILWCKAHGLNMVLDLHKTFGYSFDDGEAESGFFENAAYQERFCRLWEEFARRFGKYESLLAFELLNEVTDKAYADTWNDISDRCIRRIRAIAPTITILIGGYFNNSIEALKDLRPPQDEHIVYNFHCYEPLIFTHQGAYWVNGMDTSFRMPYDSTYREYAEMAAREIDHYYSSFDGFAPDEPFGPAFFEQLIAEAVSVAEERDVALYCGEFGVIDLADAEDTAKWYRAICGVLDRYHIGRAAWTYKEMDFGFIDGHLGSSLEEVLFALRGQK